MTPEQQKLIKLRKAARVGACLLIFAGAVLVCMGLVTQILANVMNGAVLLAGSTLMFVAAKKVELKLTKLSA